MLIGQLSGLPLRTDDQQVLSMIFHFRCSHQVYSLFGHSFTYLFEHSQRTKSSLWILDCCASVDVLHPLIIMWLSLWFLTLCGRFLHLTSFPTQNIPDLSHVIRIPDVRLDSLAWTPALNLRYTWGGGWGFPQVSISKENTFYVFDKTYC